MPDKEKRRIQVSQRQNDPVTCQSFLSQLAARFGRTKDTLLREKWQDLAIKHSGKITIQDLHDFELDFRQIRQDLPDMTERECREHLLKKLPHHLSAHLIEKEGRLRSEKPQMLFIFPTDHSVKEVFQTVAVYVGVEPVKVAKVKPGEFCIQFSDQSAAKKMM